MTWANTISTVAPLISPVLVVVGWWLVNRQNDNRETRKETRQLIDRTLAVVDETVSSVMRYASAPAVTPTEGWTLLLSINRIRSQILQLADRGLIALDCDAAFLDLKSVATGGDFMTTARVPWPGDDKRWLQLIDARSRLVFQLDAMFARAYGSPPKDGLASFWRRARSG